MAAMNYDSNRRSRANGSGSRDSGARTEDLAIAEERDASDRALLNSDTEPSDVAVEKSRKLAAIGRLAFNAADPKNVQSLAAFAEGASDPELRHYVYTCLFTSQTPAGLKAFFEIAGTVFKDSFHDSHKGDAEFVTKLIECGFNLDEGLSNRILTFMTDNFLWLSLYGHYRDFVERIAQLPSLVERASGKCIQDLRFLESLSYMVGQPWAARLLNGIWEKGRVSDFDFGLRKLRDDIDTFEIAQSWENFADVNGTLPNLRARLMFLLGPTALNMEQVESPQLKRYLDGCEPDKKAELLQLWRSNPDEFLEKMGPESWKRVRNDDREMLHEIQRIEYALRAQRFIEERLVPFLKRVIGFHHDEHPQYPDKVLAECRRVCEPLAEKSKAAKALLDSVEAAPRYQPQS